MFCNSKLSSTFHAGTYCSLFLWTNHFNHVCLNSRLYLRLCAPNPVGWAWSTEVLYHACKWPTSLRPVSWHFYVVIGCTCISYFFKKFVRSQKPSGLVSCEFRAEISSHYSWAGGTYMHAVKTWWVILNSLRLISYARVATMVAVLITSKKEVVLSRKTTILQKKSPLTDTDFITCCRTKNTDWGALN